MEQPEQKQSMVEPDIHFQDRMAVEQARDRVQNSQTESERILWENRVNQRVEALERRIQKLESR